ncbi:MAG: hypothetical protein V1816_06205 [Pseudomonadota bacterium]
MKFLEIIVLRANFDWRESRAQDQWEALKDSLGKIDDVEISLFRDVQIETDISIHLSWEKVMEKPKKSELGLRLANSLKEFGLVYHCIWAEELIARPGSLI